MATPQPIAFTGQWTLAELNSNFPASAYPYCIAWVSDRSPPGYLTSDGVSWSDDSVPIGAPAARTLSLATAYQAANPAKPALVTVNLTSNANISLSGGTTNTADVVIGATNAVASGTGTTIGKYTNSNTGALTVGLNISTVAANPTTFVLPAGWYFAVRQTAGTVSITSAFDQAVG
jgi:hypothetical protein